MRRFTRLIVGDTVSGDGIVVDNLRMLFEVRQSVDSQPDTATVRIFNLSPERRELLDTLYSNVILEYGYAADRMSVIYAGEIYNAVHTKQQGTDVLTTLYLGSGLQALHKATTHGSHAAGTGRRALFNTIATAFEQYGVTLGNTEAIDGDQYSSRVSTFSGAVNEVLDRILDGSGVAWSIEGNQVEATALSVNESAPIVITPANGLIGSPRKTNKGIDFQCVLNPALRIGQSVGVFSHFLVSTDADLHKTRTVDPRDKGGFVLITALSHTGSNQESASYTSIVGQR